MPCWTRQMTTVDLKAVTDMDLLQQAIRALGGEVLSLAQDGRIVFRDERGRTSQIHHGQVTVDATSRFAQPGVVQRAYATATVQAAARRFGWSVKAIKEGQFELIKR